MERLTTMRDGRPVLAKGYEERFSAASLFFMLLNRLAAYEDAMPIERAQELAQAEKDGRLAVLPCNPGQKIWVESCICGMVTSIEAPDIEWIIKNSNLFGEEIFLTREEAEAALKKREAGNEAD